jgi:hypothetical protein
MSLRSSSMLTVPSSSASKSLKARRSAWTVTVEVRK